MQDMASGQQPRDLDKDLAASAAQPIQEPDVVGRASPPNEPESDVAPLEVQREEQGEELAECHDVKSSGVGQRWDHVYSWPGVVVIIMTFVALAVLLSATQGLGYKRFNIRGYDCYHPSSYMKLGEAITKELNTCVSLSYPYRLREPWWGSRTIVWVLYLVHQIGQWILLSHAQRAHERGEIGWPATIAQSVDAPADAAGTNEPTTTKTGCPVGGAVNKYAVRMFCFNMGAVFFKFVFSQISYDGLANDVPEWSAQYSVVIWIILACIIRMPGRGLFLGYFHSFPFKAGIIPDIVPYVRKFHGYAFSFGTTYNFWYHPLEGSPGFICGYLYQFCMILQSGFLFHPMHKNKWWTFILELGVIPHAALIAIFAAGQSWGQVFQFGYGFTLFGLLTHMHGLGLSRRVRAVVAVVVIASIPVAYIAVGRNLKEANEIARMAVSPLLPVIAYLLWVIFTLLMWPLRPIYERAPSTLKFLWFLVWVGHIVLFLVLGPLNAETETGDTQKVGLPGGTQ